MKTGFVYISMFMLAVVIFRFLINISPSPEILILGEWKELTWEYEKVNKTGDNIVYKNIPDEVKKSIEENLVIHEAETWEFLPRGKLRLSGDNIDKTVDWRIKGRGDILQLKYEDGLTEDYILTQLNDEVMYLNFETDVQARGIAKLTFEKIKN
ncbi:hypothetical protein BH23BAC1_BH23BAC1_20550 [soil metagenome]